jgi:hypothetical protein
MPADRPTIGTGRRRQGGHGDPEGADDSQKALEREIDEEIRTGDETRRRQSGAHTDEGAHQIIPPGTQRDIDEANPQE